MVFKPLKTSYKYLAIKLSYRRLRKYEFSKYWLVKVKILSLVIIFNFKGTYKFISKYEFSLRQGVQNSPSDSKSLMYMIH